MQSMTIIPTTQLAHDFKILWRRCLTHKSLLFLLVLWSIMTKLLLLLEYLWVSGWGCLTIQACGVRILHINFVWIVRSILSILKDDLLGLSLNSWIWLYHWARYVIWTLKLGTYDLSSYNVDFLDNLLLLTIAAVPTACCAYFDFVMIRSPSLRELILRRIEWNILTLQLIELVCSVLEVGFF